MSIYKGTEFIAGTPDMAEYAKTSDISTMLATLYPVGAIYIGTQATCPLASLISGSTWELVSEGRVLQGADSSHSANSTIAAGLPNITGDFYLEANIIVNANEQNVVFRNNSDGAFRTKYANMNTCLGQYSIVSNYRDSGINFNASNSNSIYGASSTVQPPAYVVNIWRRTA